MQYFKHIPAEYFEKQPQEIKHEDRERMAYAVGANLYMNGLMDLYEKITNGLEGVGSVTICFEDAIRETDLEECEANTLVFLNRLQRHCESGDIQREDLPFIFIRVRNLIQFKRFTARLTVGQAKFLTGFTFPKFNSHNGNAYLHHVREISSHLGHHFYGMPILESRELVYKESRLPELMALRDILSSYRAYVLNVRVGGTDFSSAYGLRRPVDLTIYDLRVVSDALTDILNSFGRAETGYVVSGPVWEYFSKDLDSPSMQGLLKEIHQDRANGFHGKTSIHPTQASLINMMSMVTHEEWTDATEIAKRAGEGGVFKGAGDNKMNEVGPHLNWAQKILARAEVYGVLKPNLAPLALYRELTTGNMQK